MLAKAEMRRHGDRTFRCRNESGKAAQARVADLDERVGDWLQAARQTGLLMRSLLLE